MDEETPGHMRREERVDIIDEEDETMLFSDPVVCAKHLCDQAAQVYEQELARRDLLTDAQRRTEGIDCRAVLQSTSSQSHGEATASAGQVRP